jgi:hypothetical protein
MDREELLREAAEEQLLQESDRRRFLYADVEELILTGRLTQVVPLDGGYIVLGSLTTTAFQNFILRSAGDEKNWMRHHVAHSITMVNGYAINQDEINAAHHLFMEWIRRIRIEYIHVLHTYVMGLRKREGRANRITHAYCQEGYSRGNWRTHPVDRGVNTTQRLWVAYNRNADAFDEDMKEWQHTRSICGSMSSKAAKSLKKSNDTWTRRREDQKQKAIEDAVNWIISGEREDQKPLTVTVNGQTLTVPKVHASQTVDEMQEELMRAVRGEKDYHDHLVHQYKEHHRAKIEAARRERQEAVDKAREAGEERGISGKTTIVGYTPAQLAEINPEVLLPTPARHSQATPEQDRFNQYLDTSVGVGWIGTDGRPEKAEASPPEGGEPESLQDKIRNRKPRLKP